jgi:hypothetical protein
VFRFPAGIGVFSRLRNVRTGSGAHRAFYTMGTGTASSGVKRQGHEADHLPPTRAEVKNGGDITLPYLNS